MSAKNKLQEIYQKRQEELPTYISVNLSGQAHEPEWKAQVKTIDGYEVWSESFGKKTQAENDAAAKCLKLREKHVERRIQNTKYIRPDKPKTILLIDLENVPQAGKVNIIAPDLRVIGFVGKYNRGILKDRAWLESIMELVITDTVCDDAADHALTFHAGVIASRYLVQAQKGEQSSLPTIIILSSDHFGAVPVEFLQKFGVIDSHSVTNLDDLSKFIPKMKIEERQI